VVEDKENADLCLRLSGWVYNYMEIEPEQVFDKPVLAGQETEALATKDIYINSAYTSVSPHRHHRDEQDVLRALVPAAAVLGLVRSVSHPNQLAVHVRMGTGSSNDHLPWEAPDNWPAARHLELTEW
jgi:hypothetical protein